jgi:hypothetical protein
MDKEYSGNKLNYQILKKETKTKCDKNPVLCYNRNYTFPIFMYPHKYQV